MQAAQPPKRQDEIEEFKRLLGPVLVRRYTEGQLLQLRREMYEMANLLLDLYMAKRRRKTGGRRLPP